MASSNQPRLKIELLSKQFTDGQKQELIIDSISFEAYQEVLGIVGPNGCGKTTLLRMIAGLEPVTTGKIKFLYGKEWITEGRRGKIAFIPQNPSLFPWMTLKDNIRTFLKVHSKSLSKDEIIKRYETWIEKLDLNGQENKYPRQLSGGQQQKGVLARTFALEPSVVLMDEPFAYLDAQTRDQMQEELQKIRSGDETILFVSHSIDETVYVSDRVILLSKSPSRIGSVFEIDLPRPRDRTAENFVKIRKQLLKKLKSLNE